MAPKVAIMTDFADIAVSGKKGCQMARKTGSKTQSLLFKNLQPISVGAWVDGHEHCGNPQGDPKVHEL